MNLLLAREFTGGEGSGCRNQLAWNGCRSARTVGLCWRRGLGREGACKRMWSSRHGVQHLLTQRSPCDSFNSVHHCCPDGRGLAVFHALLPSLCSWVLYIFHENTDLQRLWQEEPYAGVPAKIRCGREGGCLVVVVDGWVGG